MCERVGHLEHDRVLQKAFEVSAGRIRPEHNRCQVPEESLGTGSIMEKGPLRTMTIDKDRLEKIIEAAFLAGWQAACHGDFQMVGRGWRLTPRTSSGDAFQDWRNQFSQTINVGIEPKQLCER